MECRFYSARNGLTHCGLVDDQFAPAGSPNYPCDGCKLLRDGKDPQSSKQLVHDYLYRHNVPEQTRGIGDTIASITHATGLDKLAELYTKVTGKDCGCKGRQEALNKMVPYSTGNHEQPKI